ncbi:MAG: dTDP-4-dehydrorhamnose 3,5-epimerase [Phycisphaerae bacterium]|nr:dTDP-4-dehydrorhamnose 3,5-epimerase [Phycisphaerae bacterium]
MEYRKTSLPGAWVIEIQRIEDSRGFFAYSIDADEARAHGIDPTIVQGKISFNHRAGTVRGMHWQCAPATETKLIRCTRGAIHDVIVDIREGSPTYGKHFSVELSAENHRTLYIPALFAHGYQTLTDDAEVLYHVNQPYTPGCERGVRYDDPKLGIRWPLPVTEMSAKDKQWPLL